MNTWVFVCNPKNYAIDTDWTNRISGMWWVIRRVLGSPEGKEALDSAVGDRAYLWIAGKGLAARATITGHSRRLSGERRGWSEEGRSGLDPESNEVPIRIEHWLRYGQSITIDSLKSDSRTEGLAICANGGLHATQVLQSSADAKLLDEAWDMHVAAM